MGLSSELAADRNIQDLMSDNDTTFGQVRHWLAVNVSVGEDGILTVRDDALSPYIGPAPLPNYM